MIANFPDVAAYWAEVLVPAAIGTAFENNVWRGSLAPESARPPFLLYFLLSGDDARCLDGGSWAGLSADYMVKGVTSPLDYQGRFLAAIQAVSDALEQEMLQDRVLGAYRYSLLGSGSPREYEEQLPGGGVLIHSGRAWTVAVDPA